LKARRGPSYLLSRPLLQTPAAQLRERPARLTASPSVIPALALCVSCERSRNSSQALTLAQPIRKVGGILLNSAARPVSGRL
jgi:hypothetical protein